MKKIVHHSFALFLLLASHSLLPAFSHAQSAPAPAKADNSKKVKDSISFEQFKRDFNNTKWNPFSADSAKTIKTVTIGTQTWMVQNLDVSHFRNGDAIPEAKTDNEWNTALLEKKPAWCYYNNDPANGEKYGKLYNRFAVNDRRGLAPEGWRVPVKYEWEKMINSLPDDVETGKKLKSTGEGGYGFIPGGLRYEHSFAGMGIVGQWWSGAYSYESSDPHKCDGFSLNKVLNKLYYGLYCKEGLSVRCFKINN